MNISLERIFFHLLRCAVEEKTIEEDLRLSITPEILKSLYKLAQKHDVTHLVADALDRNACLNYGTEASKAFLQKRDISVYRYKQLQHELLMLSDTLEKAKIPFMPLKGSVIRDLYPEPWMRTSCDIDVLVKEEDLEAAIETLESMLNYKRGNIGAHDVSLIAPSGAHIELHFCLSTEDKFSEILQGAWEILIPGWSCKYAMSPEMFYFYHIAHMAIHMRTGGCGVKPFIDMLVIRANISFSRERVDDLLRKAGLASFEREVVNLTDCWFKEGKNTTVTEALQTYVLYGGVYGNVENRVAVQQTKKGGKVRYIFSRVFVSYYELSIKYPSLKKRRFLLPAYQVYRWFDLFINKKSRVYTKETIRQTYKSNKEQLSTIEELFEVLEL